MNPSRVVNDAGAALAAFSACRRWAAIHANARTNDDGARPATSRTSDGQVDRLVADFAKP